MILQRTDWPLLHVVMGSLGPWFTLQHLPTPVGVYALVPHVVQTGPLAGLHCVCLVNEALGVFEEPNEAYTGPYPMRYAVLIHPGNYPKDTKGCIIIGTTRDTLPDPPNVGQSRLAFDAMMAALGPGETLEILD